MKKAFLLLILGLAGAWPALAGEVRIMTWDVEDAFPPGKAEILAKVIRERDVDLLALQNVETRKDSFASVLQNRLDRSFGTGVYRHRATAGEKFDSGAVFWNTKTVQVLDSREDKSLVIEKMTRRPAQIVRARAGAFDFYLVNVNLYEGIGDDDGLKLEQASALGTLLRKLEKARPVVLAGNLQMGFPDERIHDEMFDTMQTSPNPAYLELNSDEFLSFCTREIVKKDPRAFSYIGDVLEGGRLIDHIAASRNAWKRYVKGSARIVRVDKDHYDGLEDYEWNFSDHLPVLAKFRTD